jgi:hypothetical protein
MKIAFLLPALLCALLTANLPAATPDDLRAEAEKLIEKARQGKSAGRTDEAEELMGRAKRIQMELREKIDGSEQPKGGDAKLERMKQEIGELHRAGKHEEAGRLEHQFAEAQQRRASGGRPEPQVEGPERVRHIMEAVAHLHAAGLKEPAENLEQIARRMREELEHRGDSAGAAGAGQMEHALREVHEGMEQLRRQMEKMQRQIEEMREQSGRHGSEKEKG